MLTKPVIRADAALAEEQARRRKADAEAAAQRALVQQLLAAQMLDASLMLQRGGGATATPAPPSTTTTAALATPSAAAEEEEADSGKGNGEGEGEEGKGASEGEEGNGTPPPPSSLFPGLFDGCWLCAALCALWACLAAAPAGAAAAAEAAAEALAARVEPWCETAEAGVLRAAAVMVWLVRLAFCAGGAAQRAARAARARLLARPPASSEERASSSDTAAAAEEEEEEAAKSDGGGGAAPAARPPAPDLLQWFDALDEGLQIMLSYTLLMTFVALPLTAWLVLGLPMPSPSYALMAGGGGTQHHQRYLRLPLDHVMQQQPSFATGTATATPSTPPMPRQDAVPPHLQRAPPFSTAPGAPPASAPSPPSPAADDAVVAPAPPLVFADIRVNRRRAVRAVSPPPPPPPTRRDAPPPCLELQTPPSAALAHNDADGGTAPAADGLPAAGAAALPLPRAWRRGAPPPCLELHDAAHQPSSGLGFALAMPPLVLLPPANSSSAVGGGGNATISAASVATAAARRRRTPQEAERKEAPVADVTAEEEARPLRRLRMRHLVLRAQEQALGAQQARVRALMRDLEDAMRALADDGSPSPAAVTDEMEDDGDGESASPPHGSGEQDAAPAVDGGDVPPLAGPVTPPPPPSFDDSLVHFEVDDFDEEGGAEEVRLLTGPATPSPPTSSDDDSVHFEVDDFDEEGGEEEVRQLRYYRWRADEPLPAWLANSTAATATASDLNDGTPAATMATVSAASAGSDAEGKVAADVNVTGAGPHSGVRVLKVPLTERTPPSAATPRAPAASSGAAPANSSGAAAWSWDKPQATPAPHVGAAPPPRAPPCPTLLPGRLRAAPTLSPSAGFAGAATSRPPLALPAPRNDATLTFTAFIDAVRAARAVTRLLEGLPTPPTAMQALTTWVGAAAVAPLAGGVPAAALLSAAAPPAVAMATTRHAPLRPAAGLAAPAAAALGGGGNASRDANRTAAASHLTRMQVRPSHPPLSSLFRCH